ncbi:ribonuclease J [Paracoccaceae bacterium]|jgi:ribonuclease J|nr:ribonuclease J [Paracoccaceae bacterium]MDA9612688.1 ribonuclease J [Paracoccaceae bacterium]MDA9670551.1 ribonuclease J [Paracoccaceae bacterium]
MTEDRLIYLPLGGAGEIGMNLYVYGYGPQDNERLIIVDLGVAFPDMDTTPGVDLIFPDISWLKDRRNQIEAIFITHAHEDHVGALGHLWAELGAPVYARKFTSKIASRKLEENGQSSRIVNVVSSWPATTKIGPFEVSYLPVSHSIPESSALVIDTPKGRLIHSGDFKLDEDPVVGEAFDHELWRKVCSSGVRALICDSTNIFSENEGRSESEVAPEIQKLIENCSAMVVATTFASNVARIKSIAEAAEKAGRSVCLMGRAMKRMVEVSLEAGVLSDFPKLISPEDAKAIPKRNLLLIVTGSQGERRAASAQLANGKYQGMTLSAGDLFLFSSKTIPGNERGVIKIMNQLSEKGVDVVDDSSGKYHVSGHANRPEISRIHDIVSPQFLLPMHGEHRHLREHVKLGEVKGVSGLLATNGTMVDLSGNQLKVVDHVDTGRVYLDGTLKFGALDGIVRDRIKLAVNGLIVVNIIIDENDEMLGEPWCELRGLADSGHSECNFVDVLEEDLSQYIGRSSVSTIKDENKLEKDIKRVARQTALNEIGKKPEISIIISRLSSN